MKKSKGCAIAPNLFEGRDKNVAVKNGPSLPRRLLALLRNNGHQRRTGNNRGSVPLPFVSFPLR